MSLPLVECNLKKIPNFVPQVRNSFFSKTPKIHFYIKSVFECLLSKNAIISNPKCQIIDS